MIFHLLDTISISKDNAAARRRHRRRIYTYVEEADDDANKVSQRKRIGIGFIFKPLFKLNQTDSIKHLSKISPGNFSMYGVVDNIRKNVIV